MARADGSYSKITKKLAKPKVLISHDLGLAPMRTQERRDLLEVAEDRHRLASSIMAAQLPIEHWHENIRNPTIADAVLDRLLHNAYKVNLERESMRKLRSSLPHIQTGYIYGDPQSFPTFTFWQLSVPGCAFPSHLSIPPSPCSTLWHPDGMELCERSLHSQASTVWHGLMYLCTRHSFLKLF